MDAVISGRVGKALLLEGDSLQSFDVDDPGTLLPMRPSDYQLLFADAPDVQFLEDTDAGSVARALEFEHNCACALDVALISLDPELSTQLRTEAVDALEELLRDEQILARLENILYAELLPPNTDIRGAIECCEANRATAVRGMFELLRHHQQAIRDVKLTWDAIPLRTFEDEENRQQFKHLVIHEGLFHSLVLARGSQPRIDRFRLNSMLNPSVQRTRHSREVLQQWVAPFLMKNNMPGLTPEIEGEEEQRSYSERLRRRERRSFNRARVRENVERQKELIVRSMQRRDLARAREVVEELVEYHMEYGGAEFAVKSLCDLAMAAKTLGNHPLQLELTQRCIELQPDDARSWTQHADALLQMQQLGAALAAYDQAISFGADVVAKNGRAEVLKALGRLDEALVAYKKTIAEHPDNAVAKNGRAEVLKALGRYDEALVAYKEAIAEHPGDVVAKTGRAEVLKALGRFDEALAAYNEAIAEHPGDVVAKSGRAEVLKALGRFDEALTAYDEAIAEHPGDVVAKSGRAEVLKALGRLDEALVAYKKTIAEHPDNAVAKTGRAEVLKALGRYDEALVAYEEVIAEHSEDVFAKTGRAEVLKALGRYNEALVAYKKTIAEHPDNAVAKTGRAEVLKALGRYDEALVAYKEAIAEHPENVVAKTGRAEVLKALGRFDEALAAYNEAIAEHPGDVVAKNGRAEVLKTCGRLEEALVAYNAISIERPQDAFTRNGRSSVLLALKRFDEALESLPERNLATKNDWIGLHIRGMVLLRMSRLDEAIEVFERGVRENPWILDREVFRAGLALVRLKRRNFMEARRVLDEVSPSLLQTQVNVLRLHSCGELGEDECAIAAYRNLSAEPWLIPADLIEELHRRYILKEGARHDDDWVIEKEADTLLLLANQYAINSQAYQY